MFLSCRVGHFPIYLWSPSYTSKPSLPSNSIFCIHLRHWVGHRSVWLRVWLRVFLLSILVWIVFWIWILPSFFNSFTTKENPQKQHTFVLLYIFAVSSLGRSHLKFLRNTLGKFYKFMHIPKARSWAKDSVANALIGGLKRSMDLTWESGFVRSLCSDLLGADQRSNLILIRLLKAPHILKVA